jgi:hypothetical protein
MPDYNVVITWVPSTIDRMGRTVGPSLTVLVNGEVCRQNDYDHLDPDFDRQQAMETCLEMERGADPFVQDKGHTAVLPLIEVASQLFGWSWREKALTDDDLLEVSMQISQNILLLSRPGEGL